MYTDGPHVSQHVLLSGRIVRSRLFLECGDRVQMFEVGSGSPALAYVVTADSIDLGLEPFSAELFSNRFLLLKRKQAIETVLQQNEAFVGKSPEQQWPGPSGFEVELRADDVGMLFLHSVKFDEASRTLYILFVPTTDVFTDCNSESLALDLAVNCAQLRLRTSISIRQGPKDHSQRGFDQSVLLAIGLETGALEYQLVSSCLDLTLVSVDKNNILFGFFCLDCKIGDFQRVAKLTFSTDHLRKFERVTDSNFYSGTLSVPNRLRPLSAQSDQVLQSSVPEDCKWPAVPRRLLTSRSPTLHFFQLREPNRLFRLRRVPTRP